MKAARTLVQNTLGVGHALFLKDTTSKTGN